MILGIDFGGTKIAIATADHAGHLLARSDIPTSGEQGALQAVTRALDEAGRLVDETTRMGHGLDAIGIATMGITQEDRVLYAPNVPGWERLRLPDLIRERFPSIPVHIENDVKSAAWAELKWGHLDPEEPGIFLNLGTGIGIALAAHGRILRGAHGASGEVAYCPLTLDSQGARHGIAPLEELVGGGPIKERASRAMGTEMSAGALFRRPLDDPPVKRLVEPILRAMAFYLMQWTIAFDPSRVVVGGGLVNVSDVIFPVLEASLEEFVPFPPELVAAHYLRDAGLMGALAVALAPF